MAAVTIHGKSILVLNVDGNIRAYANQCPHQASPLDAGELDGETLTCAAHLWVFNALTGDGVNPRLARLTGYACDVRADGNVYVMVGP